MEAHKSAIQHLFVSAVAIRVAMETVEKFDNGLIDGFFISLFTPHDAITSIFVRHSVPL